jgi:sugar phosphate isomerase/epimerase
MKISIASYAFHGLLQAGMMDVFGYLETSKYRYHVNAADIWNGFLPTTDDDFLKKVKGALAEREMPLANLCVDGAHIWEDDQAARERNYQVALEHLRAGELLGAETIRIDAGGRGETWTDEQFDLIVRRYKEWAQRAYDNGYKVGPENHWGTEVDPANMQKLVEAVDHPAFGVLLHFRGNGSKDMPSGDAVMAPWAMHTHISWDVAERCLEESLPMLRDAGYSGYYSIEHHSGENEYARTAVQVARVRELMSRW